MSISAKIIHFILISTTFIPLLVCATSPSQPPRWVTADNLRIRSNPGTENPIIGTLSRGSEVILKAPVSGEYCLIEGEGLYGYIVCNYLTVERIARPKAGENGIDVAQRWISGNGVTLREAPYPDATVIGRLSLNSIVKLVQEIAKTGYCEIQKNDGKSAYTACRYLAITPVVIAHVRGDRSGDEATTAAYDPERAFWLEPGWYALERYAEYLKQQQPDTEMEGPWSRNEALEKMKAHLALGLKARKPSVYVDWLELKAKVRGNPNEVSKQNYASNLAGVIGIYGELHNGIREEGALHVIKLIQALEFPSIKPSLFLSETEIAPPSSSVEDASGRFDIIYRQLVTPRSRLKDENDRLNGAGLYDMLARTQMLVKPVQRVQLFRDGQLKIENSYLRQKEILWRATDSPMCEGAFDGFSYGDADPSTWRNSDGGDPQVNPKGSLYAFYTNKKLLLVSALRTEIPIKLTRKETGFVRGIHLTYDLDRDGVPDLAVWEGQGKGPGHLDGPTKTDDWWYRLILVNIAGKWKILGSDQFSYGCGC